MLLTLKFNVVAPPKPHSCAQFFLYRSKAGLSKVGNNYESIRRIFQDCYGLVGALPKAYLHISVSLSGSLPGRRLEP